MSKERSIDDAVISLNDWLYSDSRIKMDAKKVKDALEADMHANCLMPPSDEDCELLITGGDEGEVPPELRKLWPHVEALIASNF